MIKNIINTKDAPQAIGPYSQAVVVGDLMYTSGQIAINPTTGEMVSGNIESQTTIVLQNIKAILESNNMDFNNVVKSTIFIKDMNDFGKLNEVYASFFSEPYPARETVEVARLPKDAIVEISIIATRK